MRAKTETGEAYHVVEEHLEDVEGPLRGSQVERLQALAVDGRECLTLLLTKEFEGPIHL